MLRTVEAATEYPVTLDEAKAHLRVDHDDDDDTIKGFIAATTLAAQNNVQRRFVTQTVEWVLQHWCRGRILLPIAPVAKNGVISIKFIDPAGVEQTLPSAQYVVQTAGESVRIIPPIGAIWPLVKHDAPEPIVIRFTVGQGADEVPANVKTAIKLILGHLYENRENVVVDPAVELPQGAQALLLSEVW
ncbi:head-tail connector protein [Bradyrhizobium lablabi]|uniref:head-tail connector protein n=1 Tax=Bradyrhizobium lablabi TaxID=722472 RepID=UPI001BACD113|nr:head-tail connector protein [Bradyrhizobium lablabi]MBR0695952.1 phage head-tail connector protein [Bradyrhizobium lablabi]